MTTESPVRARLYVAVSSLAKAERVLAELARGDAKFKPMHKRASDVWDEAETELRAIEAEEEEERARIVQEDSREALAKELGRE